MKRRKQPILAIDSMGRRKQLPEWLAPEHVIARGRADPVGRVGLARREFVERERPGEAFDIGFEPRAERGLVDQLLDHGCFLSSSRAIARRWTSSGPSASRSVRICE